MNARGGLFFLVVGFAARDKRDLNERASFTPLASSIDEMLVVYQYTSRRRFKNSL